MWKLAFKQLWKNRKSNYWILTELFVVSILLWYCVDFLYVVVRKNLEPMGVDTEHVYRLKLGANPTVPINRSHPDSIQAQWIDPLLQIVRLTEAYPGVEAAAYYYGTEPYDDNWMMQGYAVNEENAYRGIIRYVSGNYDKVFKVDMREGGFADWHINQTPQGAVVSEELADSLFHSRSAMGKTFHDHYEPSLNFKVSGVSRSMKYDVYGRYEPFIYTPFNTPRLAYTIPVIGIRVKASADTHGFAQQFINNMKSKLNIGPFYLFNFTSYDFKAEVYDTATGITKYISVISGVIVFFLFIVFLGILGTFWFTIETRRPEIGLRMAVGSTRRGVLYYFFSESLILFFLSFIPAFIVCASLAYWDVTYTFNDAMDYSWIRFWQTQLFTVLIMTGIITAGVIAPARRASRIHPVEALRENG
ncbi:MAG TPA: hypothetical protein DDZ96_05480 [Porphyromonadaceae bacterium]|jgi:putative ABC transport system permease protein|nr:hypothetical protein [Porphyromonadaceae bacterium]HBL33256.1 hypothetical protein [Porphyromonadaceae bacterium]HBX19172.1 hypothetical protein [Porphyromonadaceae bacterium]HCM22028.1 hypothetical protein [Porphyromonadaceae bacterium]